MGECISIPHDIFIEKPVTDVKTEYHVYALQEDGWYDPYGKYIMECALASQWGPYPTELEAQEHFKSYLSQKNREAYIIKRVITTVIDSEGPLIRTLQITETIVERGSSIEIS